MRDGESELMSKTELNVVFGKIKSLIQVHSDILQRLRNQLGDAKSSNLVGKIWSDIYAELGKVYPPYINSYDDILRTLDMAVSTRPKLAAFFKV